MESNSVSKDIERLKQIDDRILELEAAKDLLEETICTWTEQEEECLTACGFEKIHSRKFMLRAGLGPRFVDLHVLKTWSEEAKRICFRGYFDPGGQSTTTFQLLYLLESLEELVSQRLEQAKKDFTEAFRRTADLEILLHALRQEEEEQEEEEQEEGEH